jgi:hypothetical protein
LFHECCGIWTSNSEAVEWVPCVAAVDGACVGKVRAVDCRLNQPEMWLILAIDSIRGGYLFLN